MQQLGHAVMPMALIQWLLSAFFLGIIELSWQALPLLSCTQSHCPVVLLDTVLLTLTSQPMEQDHIQRLSNLTVLMLAVHLLLTDSAGCCTTSYLDMHRM